jgi:capsular polysaccharide biosynthesis protein
MTVREIIAVLLRRWWLVAIVPAIVLSLLIVRARMQPYQSTMKAVVLIPGDTQTPGDSERPELMVMDDLPTLISSRVFAEAVASDIVSRGQEIDVDTVKNALSASRYSRVLTITATQDNEEVAREIGGSAAAVLPGIVNQYLVGDQSNPATVQIIDPPGEPTRSRPHQALIILVLTLVAAAAGAGLALVAHAWSDSSPTRNAGI